MHIVTEESSAPPTSQLKLMTASQTNGLAWVAYRRRPASGEADSFFFIVTTLAPEAKALHTSGDFATAPKAERAAREWCNDYVPQPSSPEPTEPAEPAEPAALEPAEPEIAGAAEGAPAEESNTAGGAPPPFEGEPTEFSASDIIVGGWLIYIEPSKRGGFDGECRDTWTGEIATEDFKGYETAAACEAAARTWAEENPTATELARRSAEAGEAEAAAVDPAPVPEAPPGPAAPPAPAASPAPAPTPATPTPAPPPRSDRSEDWSTVDEVWTLLAQRDEISDRLAIAEAAKARAAAQAKEISKQLAEVDTQIRVARNNAERQRSLPLHPAPRPTFASSEQTRGRIGEEAANVASRLGADGPRSSRLTWSFNAVEHTICHEQVAGADGPRFVAWIDGRRDETEGHGESLEQAVEACKNTASVIFADSDPGQTTPSTDAGPVADGQRTPPKRGRKPKLGKHAYADVIAELEKHLSIVDVARELGCTPQQLDEYLTKTETGISKHLGRKAGEETEAPAAKVGKVRGRRKAGGK